MIGKVSCGLLVAVCLLAGGCSDDGRQAMEGTVTLDGQPLAEGAISFAPQQGVNSPSAGANINEGRFSIARDKGVMPGKFRVEITAKRKTGQKLFSDTAGGLVDQYEQFLPAKFNRESQLSAEVKAGANQFEFAVTSQ